MNLYYGAKSLCAITMSLLVLCNCVPLDNSTEIVIHNDAFTISSTPEYVNPTQDFSQQPNIEEETRTPAINLEEEPTFGSFKEETIECTITPTNISTTLVYTLEEMHVVPVMTENAKEIFLKGLNAGRISNRFSKIGDCQNSTTYFIASFDTGEYDLGEYQHLQEAIDWFAGSYSRESIAVRGGLNAAAAMNSLFADKDYCEPSEGSVQCELREWNPSFVLINEEEWWPGKGGHEKYEVYLRAIIEYCISQNVVPILSTKTDNIDGEGHPINNIIVKLAEEFDIPLWNLWRAEQEVVNNGISSEPGDEFHLSHGRRYDFSQETNYSGWQTRNFTALQATFQMFELAKEYIE